MDVCAGMYMYNDVTLKWCAFVCTNDFSISFVWFLDSIVDVIRLFAVFCYWKSNSWALLNWNSTAWEYKMENGVCVFCFALCVNVCVCMRLSLEWWQHNRTLPQDTLFRNNENNNKVHNAMYQWSTPYSISAYIRAALYFNTATIHDVF